MNPIQQVRTPGPIAGSMDEFAIRFPLNEKNSLGTSWYSRVTVKKVRDGGVTEQSAKRFCLRLTPAGS